MGGFGIGPMEMLIIGTIAVMLFGDKLPDVLKSLGRSFGEFRRGMQGFTDQIDRAGPSTSSSYHASSYSSPSGSSSSSSASSFNPIDDREEATAPKFEPPKSEPVVSNQPAEPAA